MEPNTDILQAVTDTELDALVTSTLDEAGVGLEELRHQAQRGRFDSDKRRRT